MKSLRDFLAEFYESTSALIIDEVVDVAPYLWRNRSKKEKEELPLAKLFRVRNIDNGNYHNVVLTLKEGEWFIWCGDQYIQELGYTESYCHAWRDKARKCKHCKYVANVMLYDESILLDVEKDLLKANGIEVEEETKKETSIPKDVLHIGWKKKLPTLLYGRTGAGKSHSVFQLIKELKEAGEEFEMFQINMSSGVEDVDLIAKILPNPKEKSWITLDGELKKAFQTAKEKSVIIFIEELTRASRSARNLLLKCLDPVSGEYTLFDFIKGETISIPIHRIWWVATANLNYSDTDDVDPALLRRFVLTKYVDYDIEAERKMLAEILEDENDVEKILKMTQAIRKLYERGEIPQPLDTGSLKVFAELYKEIGDAEAVAEMTFLYRIVDVDATSSPSKEQIETIKEIIKKIFE